MALEEYQRKRNFRVTAEPAGKVARKRPKSLTFVVQKHAATRLHYDFRLELDGVLKSWAVPKGPSLDPHEKRLAVEVEDHPLDYAGFEGSIPEGEYGAGDVIVWDRGTWQPLGDARQGLRAGKLDFELHGEKLGGRWTLIRTRGRAAGEKKNWLLFKRSDEQARPLADFDVTVERPESVKSGRQLTAAGKLTPRPKRPAKKAKRATKRPTHSRAVPAHARQGRRAKRGSRAAGSTAGGSPEPLPEAVDLQLATLAAEPPAGEQWIHEIKYDGYRMLCRLQAGQVKLITRRRQDWTHRYPTIARAAAELPADEALLDGEVCAVLASGVTSFQALQNLGKNGHRVRLLYYAFDLLHQNGRDLRSLPLVERKELLRTLLASADASAIQFSEHFEVAGSVLLKESCRLGLEGIISKRRDRPYLSGRTADWLKSKCLGREELVIGGFTLSAAEKRGIGALLVGYFEDGSLRYAGRVGTGFSAATLLDLRQRLEKLKQPACPFASVPAKERSRLVRWVQPRLVTEIAFATWTDSGVLRQPSFQGLREDKVATQIVRPPSLPSAKETEMPARSKRPSRLRKANKPAAAKRLPTTALPQELKVELTHPERVLWPDIGLTKVGLAAFYAQIADWILPHLIDRPLSMVRCPQGQAGNCFYQKHAMPGTPRELARVPVQESDGVEEYLAVRDLAGLMALVQTSILEIHPWGSRRDRLDNPDRIIIDLDPDEGLPWQRVIDAALETRDLLDDLGLVSFLKTTGGKGLHVVVPIAPRRHDWDTVKAFARSVAEKLVARRPSHYVATMSKAQRRGKIFVDYLRNDHGSTAIAAYSTRAKPGAPVSTPLAWEELSPKVKSDYFTVQNLPARLQSLDGDPWAEIDHVKQTLPKRS